MDEMNNLGFLLAAACRKFGPAIAIEAAETVTYQALLDKAAGIRHALAESGCQPNEPVHVLVSNHPADLASFLGVWLAGGVVIPIHRTSPASVIDGVLNKSRARFVVDVAVSSDAASNASALTRLSDTPPAPRAQLDGAALIIFTSGSTGVPKGVVLSHASFSAKMRAIDAMIHFRKNERTLQLLNITFSFGIWSSLLTLMGGGTIALPQKFVPADLLEQLRNGRIHRVGVVPTMLRAMLAVLAQDGESRDDTTAACPALRQILTGGEQLSEQLAAQVARLFPDTDLVNIFGLTETSTCDFFQFPPDREANPHSLGLPSSRVQFRVADELNAPCAAGEVGELQIRSPFLMTGYLDEPALTDAAFFDGWFRTGDLALLDPHGQVRLMGRSKELISRGGNKVTPMEVERALKQYDAVCDCMVVGAPDAILGERIHALIVPNSGFAIEADPLRAFLLTRLDRFKMPDFIYLADALPIGRTGKADRRELRNLIAGGALAPLTGRS
jgi:long-chain acyl-CoA synthetase